MKIIVSSLKMNDLSPVQTNLITKCLTCKHSSPIFALNNNLATCKSILVCRGSDLWIEALKSVQYKQYKLVRDGAVQGSPYFRKCYAQTWQSMDICNHPVPVEKFPSHIRPQIYGGYGWVRGMSNPWQSLEQGLSASGNQHAVSER